MAVQRWTFDHAQSRQARANAPLASVIVGADAGLGMGARRAPRSSRHLIAIGMIAVRQA